MRLILPLLMLSTACGASGVDVARSTLKTAAHAAKHADQSFGAAYTIAANEAREANDTQAGWDADMAEWNQAATRMRETLDTIYPALLEAEIALDAWERTERSENWSQAVMCLAAQLRRLAEILESREVRIPAQLAKILNLFPEATC